MPKDSRVRNYCCWFVNLFWTEYMTGYADNQCEFHTMGGDIHANVTHVHDF